MAFAPAVLIALFAFWAGTFHGGATFSGASIGYGGLLAAVAIAAGATWRDPLGLGAVGRWLPVVLWLTAILSCVFSPVPRAGLVGCVLLPAFLMVPAVVAGCWPDAERRRRGVLALSAVVAAVAAWSLAHLALFDPPRAAMPLGHHNLLAGFLVALLPIALLPLRERATRWLGAISGLLSLAAIFATGSLLGIVAVAAQALLALLWWRRWHKLLLPAALLVLGLQMPRALSIVRGADDSANARSTYLEAGWRGVGQRPLVGWGPGSTPWTIAEHLRPRPGVNPPSEVVGDLHSLPLQILYELGWLGFAGALGTAALFLRRRLGERAVAQDASLLAAGLIGLLGAAVTRLGGASLAVTALPLTVGIAAGAALAARPRAEPAAGATRAAGVRHRVVTAYVAASALLLIRPLLAMRAYESPAGPALAERLDPAFPLYAARAAWLRPDLPAAAEESLDAAERARGLAPFWLQGGWLASRAGSGGEAALLALRRAAELDPLAAPAPFWLALVGSPDPADAEAWAARALAAEPRLLAALAWRERPELRRAAVKRLERDPDIDPGWRAAVVQTLAKVEAAPASSTTARLGLEMDAEPHLAFSLHAFRRKPFPALLAPIEVDAALAEAIALPAAPSWLETR